MHYACMCLVSCPHTRATGFVSSNVNLDRPCLALIYSSFLALASMLYVAARQMRGGGFAWIPCNVVRACQWPAHAHWKLPAPATNGDRWRLATGGRAGTEWGREASRKASPPRWHRHWMDRLRKGVALHVPRRPLLLSVHDHDAGRPGHRRRRWSHARPTAAGAEHMGEGTHRSGSAGALRPSLAGVDGAFGCGLRCLSPQPGAAAGVGLVLVCLLEPRLLDAHLSAQSFQLLASRLHMHASRRTV